MDKATAIKKLGKLLGKNLGYRVDPKAPSQEERETARLAITPAIKERDALQAARDERRRVILEADTEYQRLFAEAKAASERLSGLSAIRSHYKITVGTTNGMFFLVKAEGDNWAQVVARVEGKKP